MSSYFFVFAVGVGGCFVLFVNSSRSSDFCLFSIFEVLGIVSGVLYFGLFYFISIYGGVYYSFYFIDKTEIKALISKVSCLRLRRFRSLFFNGWAFLFFVGMIL